MKPGTRVLILKDCREEETATGELATYEGKFKHSEFAANNPRLRLDDGTVIWGIECWWTDWANTKGES